MDQRTGLVMGRYRDYLNQRKQQQEGFWSKFLKRTSFRARQLAKQPVESIIYYTLAALPVPMWAEQDAAQVTNWAASKWGSKFEPPHLPSEREESLLKVAADKEFKNFLARDPTARFAFVQHYQEQRGSIPVEIHRLLPRAARPPVAPRFANFVRNSALVKRLRERKPVEPRFRKLAFR